MYRTCAYVALLSLIALASGLAWADDVAYYFNESNELIDLTYPGTEFYGEVDLSLIALNELHIEVNVYVSPGEFDSLGTYITSPLVPGSKFGIQKFGANSALIVTEDDYNTFLSLYDVGMPKQWSCEYGTMADGFGVFEFWYTGLGNWRVDPLVIDIVPKEGAVIPAEFEIDSVFDFVEASELGYYFCMHVADFTVDPSYWDNGFTDVESAFFGVGGDTLVPEPSSVFIVFFGLTAVVFLRRRRR